MASELLEADAMTQARLAPRLIREKRHERSAEPRAGARPSNGFDDTAALEATILGLKEAVRADPTDANAYCVLGVILGRLGRQDASIRAWTTAARLSPDDVQIAAGLAMVLGRAGRSAEARGVFSEIVETHPELVAELRQAEVRAGGGRTRSRGAGAWREHSLSGDLARFPLPDLIEFLVNQRASGVVRLETSSGEPSGAMVILQGRLIGCRAPDTRTIDELLIEAGAMPADRPRSIDGDDSLQATYLLSCLLVEHGLLDRNALEDALHAQVSSGLRRLLCLKEGVFTVTDLEWTHELPACALDLAVDPRAVLLDLVRLYDEAQRAPSPRPSLRGLSPSAEFLSPVERRSSSQQAPRAHGS